MKIKDIEIDFDFLDADNVEKLENSAKKVVERCKNAKISSLGMAEAIREECKIIDIFIDDVFGEGISEKVFKGKMNLSEHIKVFEEIIKSKNEKQEELQRTFNRYMPNKNYKRKY